MISRRILAAAALLCPLSAPAQAQSSAITINPTAGTTNQGLVINQTLPPSGVAPGPLLLNSITATNPGLATSGSGWDSFGQIRSQINALRINYATTSTNAANNGAFSVANFVTGSDESYGGALGTTIDSNAASHQTWGLIGYTTVWPGGAIHTAVGVEAEVGVSTGGSANYRIGVGANSQGPVQGGTLDAAFSASTIGNQVPGSGASSASWQHLMALSVLYGVDPASPVIAPTGDFFFSETALTVAHFANLPNVTVTGNILSFPNATLTGAGNLNLAGTINGVTLNNAPWSTYMPDVTAQVGTPIGLSATGRYKQFGKTVIAEAVVLIGDKGSAAGGLFVKLPVNTATPAAYRFAGSTYEAAVTGKSGGAAIIGAIDPTRLQTTDATGASWWVSGYTLIITITYEAA